MMEAAERKLKDTEGFGVPGRKLYLVFIFWWKFRFLSNKGSHTKKIKTHSTVT